jgi:hypothetical protein
MPLFPLTPHHRAGQLARAVRTHPSLRPALRPLWSLLQTQPQILLRALLYLLLRALPLIVIPAQALAQTSPRPNATAPVAPPSVTLSATSTATPSTDPAASPAADKAADTSALSAANSAYLAELIATAEQRALHLRPEWRTLLHYQPRLGLLAQRSLADSPDFFFSPRGATDSRAELAATLTAFFAGPVVETDQIQHPQCRFVARYHWLKNELGFDPARLPPQPCPRFEAWHRALDPGGVTLVFPAAYLNNPASMYGHTLLRVDQRGARSQLLGYAINYAAGTDETSGLVFAVRGLLGGYPGNFSVSPYYAKVGEYNDLENRDIWEYELTLTEAETDRLLMHAWELGGVRFDYYFLDENCSYHLLFLLDAARPGLGLADRFPFWVIPGDTVQAIVAQPELVRQVRYRPARSTQIAHRLSLLPPALVDLVRRLAEPGAALDDPQWAALPAEQQAQVLDLAFEYLEYRRLRGNLTNAQTSPQLHRLLVARSKVDAPDLPGPPTPALRPEHGHGSGLAALGAGREMGRTYQSLRLRPAYHDLLDPEAGYLPGAQIEFMKLELRHDQDSAELQLQQLTFASIVSLAPRNALLKPLSWRLDVGAKRMALPGDPDPLLAHLDLGAGLAVQTGGVQGYVMGEGSLLGGGALAEHHALGAGASAGLLLDLTPRWRLHAWGRGLRYFSGERHDRVTYALDQRYTLSRDLALRLETAWQEQAPQGKPLGSRTRWRDAGSAMLYLDLHF